MSDGGLAARTLRNLSWSTTAGSIQAVGQIGAIAILARILAPGDFGVVGTAWIFIGLATFVSQLSLQQALVQHPNIRTHHFQTATTLMTGLGLAASVALYASAPWLQSAFGMPHLGSALRYLLPVIILSALTAAPEASLQRGLRFRELAFIQGTSFIAGYGIVSTIAAWLGQLGLYSLVLGYISQAVLRMTITKWRSRLRWKFHLDAVAARDLLNYGPKLTLSLVPTFVTLQFDSFAAGRWLGAADVGLYQRALNVMSFPTMLAGNAIDGVMFPVVAGLHDDPERVRNGYQRATQAVALLTLPSAGLLVILAPELVRVLLGTEWAMATLPLRILAIGAFFRVSYRVSDSLTKASAALGARTWRQVIWMTTTVVGVSIGSRSGIAAISAGVVIGLGVAWLSTAHLALRLTSSTWTDYWVLHWRALAAGAVTVCLAAATSALFRSLVLPPLAVIVLTTLIAGIAALVVYRRAPSWLLGDDVNWFKAVIRQADRRA